MQYNDFTLFINGKYLSFRMYDYPCDKVFNGQYLYIIAEKQAENTMMFLKAGIMQNNKVLESLDKKFDILLTYKISDMPNAVKILGDKDFNEYFKSLWTYSTRTQ